MSTPSARDNRTHPIWIDLDNSPHIPFFAPIIEELKRRGFDVVLTARDTYQVCELADMRGFRYQRIGRHYGKSRVLKVLGTAFRAMRLAAFSLRHRPALALNHGSRSQVLAAGLTGLPSLTIGDYEFAGPSLLAKPTWMLMPDVVFKSLAHAEADHMMAYRGIKEDVYVPEFTPDPSILTRLGLAPTQIVATVRPPATEAHYHVAESDHVFEATIAHLAAHPDVVIVLVPRSATQAAAIRSGWPDLIASGKMRIPTHAEDGLNLIWHSDVVVSGGGTMNREAAALGVPVFSIFCGRIGAVDRHLAETGRLTLVRSPAEVAEKIPLVKREPTSHRVDKNPTLADVVDHIARLADQSGVKR